MHEKSGCSQDFAHCLGMGQVLLLSSLWTRHVTSGALRTWVFSHARTHCMACSGTSAMFTVTSQHLCDAVCNHPRFNMLSAACLLRMCLGCCCWSPVTFVCSVCLLQDVLLPLACIQSLLMYQGVQRIFKRGSIFTLAAATWT
jgi:hypothetical protein